MGGIDGKRGLASTAIGTGWGSTLDLNRRVGPQSPEQVAEQFESILVQQMLQSMRSASGESELWGGPGAEMARNLLDETLSASVAHAGGLGLARALLGSFHGVPPTAPDATPTPQATDPVTNPSSSPRNLPKTSVPRANVGPEHHFAAAMTVGKDGKAP